MAEEYTREWKFRAWNPAEKKMFSPEDLEEPDTDESTPKTIYGQLIDGKVKIFDIKTNPPTEYLPLQNTNWFDREQYEVYEGDIVEIDGKYSQVIWDDNTAGFLLLDEEGNAYPGGAYLSDVMKIEGNVFENSNADVEERRRDFTFRAWDPESKIMYMPEDIKDPQTDFTMSLYAYLSFGALYIYDFKNDPPMELIPMQFTGWTDADGKDLYEGDIVSIGEDEENEVAQISWSAEIGQFIFMSNDGTLYPGSMDTASQAKLVGNIYQNPSMIPQL